MPRATAAELGSGSGIVSLLLAARQKIAVITAAELQPSYAELTARNVALNNLEGRVRPLCADIRSLTANCTGGEVSLVVSNPPYMTCGTGKRNEKETNYLARHEVCGTIADFCAAAGRLLRHRGRFVSVWRPDRLPELFAALRREGMEPKRMTFVHADAGSEPCMVLTEAVKGAAPSLRVTAPLLLYLPCAPGERRRVLSPEAEQIYRTCSFPDERSVKKSQNNK